jgi:hopanoid biosynthesis associated protein HpnK
MKKVIINADDFGLSRSINQGIIELFRNGVLTSASLLVNMPGFKDAVGLIRDNPSLGVGLHINVMRGKPVSSRDQVRSLCQGDHFRGSLVRLWTLPYIHKGVLREFAVECRAQIEKALSHGIQITHLDSEKHIHIIKPFFKVLLKVGQEYGISKIRCINEIPYLRRDLANKRSLTALYLSWRSMRNKRMLKAHQFHSPDHFYGVANTGRMNLADILEVLSNLKNGTTEIMCHPGYIDDEWQRDPLVRENYYINSARPEEISILLNTKIKGLLQQHDISLMSYKELGSPA